MKRKIFICHASEDKDEVARPLADLLRQRGFDVWYDEYTLRLGDSLRRQIDRGVGDCDFGVVILSPNFFKKEWPQRELDALTAREVGKRDKIVLPIWHKVDLAEVTTFSPAIADKVGVSTSKGISYVADSIATTAGSDVGSIVIEGTIFFREVLTSTPRSRARRLFESELDRRRAEFSCPRHGLQYGVQINTLKNDMDDESTFVWGRACCPELAQKVVSLVQWAQQVADA